ncbi:MAG TPA: helix-turn-helix domain-containing protein [Gaiellaceae bacterium]|jgi:AcrR family transcriptional regulator|nr:helix-turn-helix domain-containing protein [Gaiellaceae bacterium]
MTTALRADAQRNLVRVLEAAREVFAEQGIDAPVTDIAERAGVGVGTIFRRFPTKDDLLVAVVEQRTAQLIDAADAALESTDPGAALRSFMETAAAMHISDVCWCEAGSDLFGRDGIRELIDVLVGKMGELLTRAQTAGQVRSDVRALDIPVLLMAVAKSGLMLEEAIPGAWKRYLGIILDGLRPEAARPLPRRPLSRREFEAARKG